MVSGAAEYKGSRITDEESAVFNSILNKHNSIALMRGFYGQEEVALIVGVSGGNDGSATLIPIAMLLRPSDMDKLGDPNGVPLPG